MRDGFSDISFNLSTIPLRVPLGLLVQQESLTSRNRLRVNKKNPGTSIEML